MNAPRFTPGPWGFRVSESGAIAIFNACGSWIATTLRKQWPQEDRANAKLIAAAPELYKALSALLDQFEQRGIATDSAHPDRVAVTQARAALAKAAQS